MIKRGIAVAALAASAALVGLASPASASVGDASCDNGDACLYYNSNFQGARWTYDSSVSSYAGDVLYAWTDANGTVQSAGAGKPVTGNVASVQNRDTTLALRIYYNSNFTGPFQTIAPGGEANLSTVLKNQSGSFEWVQP